LAGTGAKVHPPGPGYREISRASEHGGPWWDAKRVDVRDLRELPRAPLAPSERPLPRDLGNYLVKCCACERATPSCYSIPKQRRLELDELEVGLRNATVVDTKVTEDAQRDVRTV